MRSFFDDFVEAIPDGINPPAEGETVPVAVLIDTATGIIDYYYNGIQLPVSHQQGIFDSRSVANAASWGGEIRNTDDDMPGTESNPARIDALKIRPIEGPMAGTELIDIVYTTRLPYYICENWNERYVETDTASYVIFWDKDPN